MIDTHTHLYSSKFEDGGREAVERAIEAGVTKMIVPGVNAGSINPMTKLHELFPDKTAIAIGLHPTDLEEDWKHDLDAMESQLMEDSSRFIAIGETGMDLYWDKTTLPIQREAFARQYEWAQRFNLPLIIHCREALDETLEVIASMPGPQPRMVFHSFTYGPEEVRRIREVCDPWFGINGVITFKNAGSLRDAIPEIGIDKLVLETDSPYLAPVPHRGKRNESAFLPLVCSEVSRLLNLSFEETVRLTDRNARELFSLS